jgi:Flp pilus assembly protein TadD
VTTARRAQQLAPDVPQINDTLGWILVENGEAEAALPYLREAVARQSDDPSLRYHLAVALHRLGRDVESAQELQIAVQQYDVDFAERSEAESLLDRLAPDRRR